MTSDWSDPRIPAAIITDPDLIPNGQRPMLEKLLDCRPSNVVVDWQASSSLGPPRFVIEASTTAVPDCVRAALPPGYRLAAGRLPRLDVLVPGE